MNSSTISYSPVFEMYSSTIVAAFLVSAYTSVAVAQYSKQFAGPFYILLKQISHCADQGTDETGFVDTRINRVNRTTYLYSSKFYMKYGFTDDMTMKLDCYQYGNGGWKLLTKGKDLGPSCSTIKRLAPKLSQSLAKASGNWPRLCPYPPGNYTIKDLPMVVELDIPILFYNTYMAEISFFHKKVKTGCGKVIIDIVPKKKSKKKQ